MYLQLGHWLCLGRHSEWQQQLFHSSNHAACGCWIYDIVPDLSAFESSARDCVDWVHDRPHSLLQYLPAEAVCNHRNVRKMHYVVCDFFHCNRTGTSLSDTVSQWNA